MNELERLEKVVEAAEAAYETVEAAYETVEAALASYRDEAVFVMSLGRGEG